MADPSATGLLDCTPQTASPLLQKWTAISHPGRTAVDCTQNSWANQIAPIYTAHPVSISCLGQSILAVVHPSH
jgi:hypothetical protein